MINFINILFFIYGLIIGSFINVLIYRLPRNETVIKGRSRCLTCGENIKPYDLIPVLSWIILKGKCRNCGAAISFTYMLVELITGSLFLISAVYFALPEAIVTALLYAVLAVIFFIDIKHLIIPDSLNTAIIVLALAMFFIRPDFKFPEYLTGAVIISAPLLIIAIITKRGVGGGDVKLFFALGLFLGWKLTLLTAFLSFVSGGLIAAALIAAKKAGRKTELPLGPPVCAAAVIATLFGDLLIEQYIGLIL